jgi:hypothetical protein
MRRTLCIPNHRTLVSKFATAAATGFSCATLRRLLPTGRGTATAALEAGRDPWSLLEERSCMLACILNTAGLEKGQGGGMLRGKLTAALRLPEFWHAIEEPKRPVPMHILILCYSVTSKQRLAPL